MTAEEVIQLLKLEPLAGEGGFFRRTYTSSFTVPAQLISPVLSGNYFSATSIFYLVTKSEFSSLHRLKFQEELFHFYLGDPVENIQIFENGECQKTLLGHDLRNGHLLQLLIRPNVWQGTKLLEGGKWALLGATVSPGFEYADFELADESILRKFPKAEALIRSYLSPHLK